MLTLLVIPCYFTNIFFNQPLRLRIELDEIEYCLSDYLKDIYDYDIEEIKSIIEKIIPEQYISFILNSIKFPDYL